MTRPVVTHYLRDNKGERTPHRLLVVDAESRVDADPRGELHTLRLWCARLIRRHGRQPTRPRSEDSEGETVSDLVDLIERATLTTEATSLFVHNLNYELALTRLPIRLVRAGWSLGQHNLASDAPWARFRKGGKLLRLADSASWLPLSNEQIGLLLGLAKPALPDLDGSEADWRARCWADVNITATAVCRLMDEWDRLGLGHWSLTGPASGWNAMLHLNKGRKPFDPGTPERPEPAETPGSGGGRTVINPDPVARAFEREAIFSGRRDLWRLGSWDSGPFCELDIRDTHLSICAAFPLPARRIKEFESLPLDDWRIRSSVVSVLARCRVRVERPRYPYRGPQAILHPVGEFETVLAGPELADARRRGELLAVGPGYVYRLSDQMMPWATWCLSVLDEQATGTDPLLRAMVKSWGRSVPGRWGMMISRETESGDSFVEDWALELATSGDPPRRAFVFHFDHRWTELVRDQEADDSFPAVLAHIQSWCRLLLNRALDAVPEDCLISCNTEGFWIHADALAEIARPLQSRSIRPANDAAVAVDASTVLSAAVAPLLVRVKQTARALRILSPQHLEVDGRPRHAGIPRSALATGPDRYEFLTWPKLKGQIERGDPAGYVRESRRVDLSGVAPSRWVYEDGCCEPVRAVWEGTEAGTRLLPPDPCCPRHAARLRPRQHSALEKLLPRT